MKILCLAIASFVPTVIFVFLYQHICTCAMFHYYNLRDIYTCQNHTGRFETFCQIYFSTYANVPPLLLYLDNQELEIRKAKASQFQQNYFLK